MIEGRGDNSAEDQIRLVKPFPIFSSMSRLVATAFQSIHKNLIADTRLAVNFYFLFQ